MCINILCSTQKSLVHKTTNGSDDTSCVSTLPISNFFCHNACFLDFQDTETLSDLKYVDVRNNINDFLYLHGLYNFKFYSGKLHFLDHEYLKKSILSRYFYLLSITICSEDPFDRDAIDVLLLKSFPKLQNLMQSLFMTKTLTCSPSCDFATLIRKK